ncbi:MAG: ABC-2 family transporter protein, partial [Planctomycetota bacterium]|jgi:ABC-2 type transport system permease protein
VVPLACVSYFPIVHILGVEDPLGSPTWLQVISPVAGIGFLAASLLLFHIGIRHYTSTGN